MRYFIDKKYRQAGCGGAIIRVVAKELHADNKARLYCERIERAKGETTMTQSENNTSNIVAIEAIKREDYILIDGERLVVTRVTNKEVAQRHLDDNITVYVVRDEEDGYLAAIATSDYKGRVSKAERVRKELIDKMMAQGLTEAQAIAVLS